MSSEKNSPKNVGELFDERVQEYDLFVRSTVIGYDEIRGSITDLVRLYLPADSSPRVLDLGIGTGNTSLAVLEACPRATIVGYDASPNMVQKARERLKEFNIEVICDDILNIDYQNEFDLAVSSIVYHHLDDTSKERGYKKIFDVLKEGGFFILADVMLSNDVSLNQLLEQRWAEFMEQKRGAEFRDSILGLEDKHHQYAALNNNLQYLANQGFRTEVYWRKMNSAIICGFK